MSSTKCVGKVTTSEMIPGSRHQTCANPAPTASWNSNSALHRQAPQSEASAHPATSRSRMTANQSCSSRCATAANHQRRATEQQSMDDGREQSTVQQSMAQSSMAAQLPAVQQQAVQPSTLGACQYVPPQPPTAGAARPPSVPRQHQTMDGEPRLRPPHGQTGHVQIGQTSVRRRSPPGQTTAGAS